MVSNILTVGPKTMTPASKTIAKIKFVLDRILTPFPKPDKAEIRKRIVAMMIMMTCTRLLLGIPKT